MYFYFIYCLRSYYSNHIRRERVNDVGGGGWRGVALQGGFDTPWTMGKGGLGVLVFPGLFFIYRYENRVLGYLSTYIFS